MAGLNGEHAIRNTFKFFIITPLQMRFFTKRKAPVFKKNMELYEHENTAYSYASVEKKKACKLTAIIHRVLKEGKYILFDKC